MCTSELAPPIAKPDHSSWEMRPSLDADEEPTPAAGSAKEEKVQVHRPLRDEPLSDAPVKPPTTVAAAAPVANDEADGSAGASGSTSQAALGASDRYVLLANLWESGSAPPSLVSSNGLLALAVPVDSPLAALFKKGDGYRFQQGNYAATYECLDVFATPQEAFASYPEGMRVSNQPLTYLHWREPSEQGALNTNSWVQAN